MKNYKEFIDEKNSFSTVKAGDVVIYTHPAYGDSEMEVERVTKTMIILKGGDRFSKDTGLQTGWKVTAPKVFGGRRKMPPHIRVKIV